MTRSRLHRATTVLLLLCPLAVAGCGGGGAPAPDGGRTVTDARGDRVAVPAAPRRVVALSEPTLDAALALGIRPIATTAGRGATGIAAYLGDRAEGVADVGLLGQPNLERIAELRPDLILTDGTAIQDDVLLGKLRRIAPTAYVSKTGQDWRTAFTATAELLGRGPAGERLLDEFDARAEAIRGRLGANAGAEVSVVRWSGVGLPATLLGELAVSRVLAQVGLERPPGQRGRGPGHSVPISLERLAELDGDWLFFASLGAGGAAGGAKAGSTGVAASRRAIELARQTPGFDDLDAVARDRVVPVDGSAWGSAGGLLAERVVLDDVERTLAR